MNFVDGILVFINGILVLVDSNVYGLCCVQNYIPYNSLYFVEYTSLWVRGPPTAEECNDHIR
jgi:hypothetical protein